MKPLYERFNNRLEQAIPYNKRNGQYPHDFMLPTSTTEYDSEIDELIILARSIQTAPQLKVAPNFTKQLQQRLLYRRAELNLKQYKGKWPFFSILHACPTFSTVLGLCLVLCILSTSVLTLAAQVSNPNNPLYRFKLLEQHFQVSLAGSADKQASLDLQFARERLNTLSGLTDVAHVGEYSQALLDLDQRIMTATSAINALPAGSQRTQLMHELANLQTDAVHDLRSLLPKLALSERLTTTGELARLGDSVPNLSSATLTLPSHPNEPATIVLTGSAIQPGAQLLVDSKLISDPGTLNNGQMIFVITWHGDQHPQTLGLLNPDGTVAQMKATIIKTTSDEKHDGDGSKNGNKPTITPTPHH